MQQSWIPGAELPAEIVKRVQVGLAHKATCPMCLASPIKMDVHNRIHALPVPPVRMGDSDVDTPVVRISCPECGGIQLFVADKLLVRFTVQ